MSTPTYGHDRMVSRLRAAGCLAAEEEAIELARAARDERHLEQLLHRRTGGEPLAWVTGRMTFAGVAITVRHGVYVPRPHTELLAEAAADALPPGGLAIDLCTGSGAIAGVLLARRPQARVLATDVDPEAAACARANGIDAHVGDLDAPLGPDLRGTVDVVTACPPYVPDADLHLLARDTRDREPLLALAGGPDGLRIANRCAAAAARLLQPGGAVLIEVGGRQAAPLARTMRRHGLLPERVGRDDDGYDRFVQAIKPA